VLHLGCVNESGYYNIRLRNTPFGYLFYFSDNNNNIDNQKTCCVDGYYNTLINVSFVSVSMLPPGRMIIVPNGNMINDFKIIWMEVVVA
jgi:hypothetical protein